MKALSMKKKAFVDNYLELPDILQTYFKENKIWLKEKEYESWGFNSHHLYSVLKQSDVPDDVDLFFEFTIPGSRRRVDVILIGRDKEDVPLVFMIEMKLWDKISQTSDMETEVWAGMSRRINPFTQVDCYCDDFHRMNTLVKSKKVKVLPFVWTPNYANVDKFLYPLKYDGYGIGKGEEELLIDELNANIISHCDLDVLGDDNWEKDTIRLLSPSEKQQKFFWELAEPWALKRITAWEESNMILPDDVKSNIVEQVISVATKQYITHYGLVFFDYNLYYLNQYLKRYKTKLEKQVKAKELKPSFTPYGYIYWSVNKYGRVPTLNLLCKKFGISQTEGLWLLLCYKAEIKNGFADAVDFYTIQPPDIKKQVTEFILSDTKSYIKKQRGLKYFGLIGDFDSVEQVAESYNITKERLRQCSVYVSNLVISNWEKLKTYKEINITSTQTLP